MRFKWVLSYKIFYTLSHHKYYRLYLPCVRTLNSSLGRLSQIHHIPGPQRTIDHSFVINVQIQNRGKPAFKIGFLSAAPSKQ